MPFDLTTSVSPINQPWHKPAAQSETARDGSPLINRNENLTWTPGDHRFPIFRQQSRIMDACNGVCVTSPLSIPPLCPGAESAAALKQGLRHWFGSFINPGGLGIMWAGLKLGPCDFPSILTFRFAGLNSPAWNRGRLIPEYRANGLFQPVR